MRYALCNHAIGQLEIERQFEVARDLGYEALEIAPFTLADDPATLTAGRIAAVRRAAADAGMEITGLHLLLVRPAGLSITSADPGVRTRTLDLLRRLIDLCADIGGTFLVHGSAAQRELPDGDALAARGRAEEVFALMGEAAGRAGLTYIVEPLAPLLTNYINSIAEAAELVARLRLPALRTMFDSSAARLGEWRPAEVLLAEWLPTGLLAHVHLNDSSHRGPGQGSDTFAPILRTLRHLDWRGWVSVEPFQFLPDGPTCAATSIGYLRGIEEALSWPVSPLAMTRPALTSRATAP